MLLISSTYFESPGSGEDISVTTSPAGFKTGIKLLVVPSYKKRNLCFETGGTLTPSKTENNIDMFFSVNEELKFALGTSRAMQHVRCTSKYKLTW